MMTEKFQPARGTRDYLPAEMAVRQRIFDSIRRIFCSYGYGEVSTPAFESFELLAAKSGEEIEKEIYSFTDKGGRKLGLRFDPTTPIARIVASNPSFPKPIKWYYITNMWRYDNPQAGRFREFWQAGFELIGSPGAEADAETLLLTRDVLKACGVERPVFRVNSRVLLDALAEEAGVPKTRVADAFRSIDKLEKIGEKGVLRELEERRVPAKAAEKLASLVSLKGKEAESVFSSIKDAAAQQEWQRLSSALDLARANGADYELDLSIVRGIDYYTGFVFETRARGFESVGSVASGGRYDSLISVYGGKPTPAVGMGAGIDRILDVTGYGNSFKQARVYVAPVSDKARNKTFQLTQQLRAAGISADTDLMGRPLGKQLDFASSTGCDYTVIIGEKELAEGTATVRDMRTGKQEKVRLEELVKRLVDI